MRLRTANHNARRQQRRIDKARAHEVWRVSAERYTQGGSARGIKDSGFVRRGAALSKAFRRWRAKGMPYDKRFS